MQTQERQQSDQVNSLNKLIKGQANDIKLLNSRLEQKQEEYLETKHQNTTFEVDIDNLNHEIETQKSDLKIYKENDIRQKEEINELNSKVKKIKTK